ncbi:MAG: YIP1 family protein [Roseobacter sp.]
MMQTKTFPELALLTLRDPLAAAAILSQWKLSREAIWTAVALISVIVTILSTISNILFPVPAQIETLVGMPFMYLVIAAGGFIGTAYAVLWAGRLLGGQTSFDQLIVLMLWLQALRAVAQVAVLVLLVFAPVLASFLVLFVGIATIWVLVQFINFSMQFDSIGRSVVTLFVAGLGLVIMLSFVLSALGFTAVGVPLNV